MIKKKISIKKLDFPDDFEKFYIKLKKSKFRTLFVYFYQNKQELISLTPLTYDSNKKFNILMLKRWRQKNKKIFYSKNNITSKTTKEYINKYIASEKLRLLFLIKYKNYYLGHLELTNYNKNNNELEITYILRGENKFKGKMSNALFCISNFLREKYKFKKIIIKVNKNNFKAISFYKKNNYLLIKKTNKVLIFKFKYIKNIVKFKNVLLSKI